MGLYLVIFKINIASKLNKKAKITTKEILKLDASKPANKLTPLGLLDGV